MILLWVTLLALHRGHAHVPVTTVQLGEPVTFTCPLPNTQVSHRKLHWYKQSAGDTLKVIVTLKKPASTQYAPGFSESRLKVNYENNFSNLTILRTIQEDEGMYHCEVTEWTAATVWSGTYLLLKGNTQRTSNLSVVQWWTGAHPVREGDSVTLQCSVFSHDMTRPGDHHVFWFRVGSNKSHPNVVYAHGKNECDRRSGAQKSCVYRLSKNISSSDAGTYYCAVATCGEILFGDGTKLTIEQTASSVFIVLVIVIACLVISLIGNIVLICYRTPRPRCESKGTKSAPLQARHDSLRQPVDDITEGGDDLNYAALHLSGRRASREKRREPEAEESLYAQVKCRV
ncbi:uncharacterized protein LOC121611948 [Chelmon rostratus]|uniref:uncharacterized protein LOC121611948 n=1 Tax=Chelmon rostratus TaxID=109905 RepID=UPI001BE53274|nr:uncharacterized protein LOC121611948 [Chelmon rostratus]